MTVRPPSTPASAWPPGLAGSLAVFCGAFLLRWVTIDFENDYFMHMAWAADMLTGERPVRDFVEPGFPLQTLLAYAGLRAGGYQLLWEAVFACVLIAAGTALTYMTCRVIGVSRGLALAVTLIAGLMYPRMYTYPKAFVYPAALFALAWYLAHPGRARLALVAAVTAVAFLFRHDHAAWIAVPTVLAFALLQWRTPKTLLRTVAEYGVVATVVVAPWVVWVAASGHVDQYFDFLLGQGRGLTNRGRIPAQRLVTDPAAPFIALAPIDFPVVGVRWAANVTPERKQQAETQYGLEPTGRADDEYRLVNLARENVAALVADPLAEDTRGIDRGSLRVPPAALPWMYLQVQRYLPPVRLRILPGVINGGNAEAWMTWVTFALPWIAVAILAALLAARASPPVNTPVAILIVAAALLSTITYQTLVRASPDSRLPDLAAVSAVLLAWLVTRAWSVAGWSGRVAKVVASLLVAITLAGALSFGRIPTRLSAAGVDGPVNLLRRAGGQAALYGGRPLDLYAPPGLEGLPGLARWINTCTREGERIAIIGFEPQVFFLSERSFAGGLAFYDLGWNSSERDQRLAIERWSRQRVPIVLAMATEWGSFSRDYPAIRGWIDDHYMTVRQSNFGGGKELTVLTDTSYTPLGSHGPTGLPCFR